MLFYRGNMNIYLMWEGVSLDPDSMGQTKIKLAVVNRPGELEAFDKLGYKRIGRAQWRQLRREQKEKAKTEMGYAGSDVSTRSK